MRRESATSLYLDAARHVTARQIVGRARRLVPPAVLALGTGTRIRSAVQLVAQGVGVEPAPQSGSVSDPHAAGTFTAYGRSRRFPDPGFWTERGDGLLFLFHLHGFSPLAEYAAGSRTPGADEFWRKVITSWLEVAAKPAVPAWHPYPTSLRLVSWSAALSSIDWSNSFKVGLADEISRQARYLARSIEDDIGGNHVIKNAVALIVAGSVVPSSGTLPRGLALLRRELSRQMLPDGGHEERSTSYHRTITHDLGDAAAVLERSGHGVPGWLSAAIAHAEAWLRALAGPDRRLPLLNDAWEGPALAERASEPTSYLPDSGYVVFRHDKDQAVFDIGPLSPSHLPPHAHADALSFVLWLDGRPLIVDPGSYSYTGPWRNPFRSTRAHNTVEVDGKDQCEFWGDFRAGFLPRVKATQLQWHGEVAVVSACHDGYARLSDPVEHQRSFIWWPGAGVIVLDILRASEPHKVSSALHLAPGEAVEGGHLVSGFELIPLGPVQEATLDDGLYSPSLGTKVTSTVIRYNRWIPPGDPFGWSVLRPGFSVAGIEGRKLVLANQSKAEFEIPLPAACSCDA